MTNQIEIDVETTYLSSESKPEENKYYFLYTVLIKNNGDKRTKLLSRHWVIKDDNGKVTPLLYPSYTQEKLKNIKSIEVDKIKVKGKEELITIYKPI